MASINANLLRKKDVVESIGLAKSTVSDWITEFQIYIPTVKQGAVTYYKPETIDVLNMIKKLREQEYSKPQIMQLLSDEGFPITVDEAVKDVERILNQSNPRDNILKVMQTTAQAVTRLAEQDEALKQHDESLKTLHKKEDDQDGRLDGLEKRTARIDNLKQQINDLQKQLSEIQEKKNKGLFSRLFKK